MLARVAIVVAVSEFNSWDMSCKGGILSVVMLHELRVALNLSSTCNPCAQLSQQAVAYIHSTSSRLGLSLPAGWILYRARHNAVTVWDRSTLTHQASVAAATAVAAALRALVGATCHMPGPHNTGKAPATAVLAAKLRRVSVITVLETVQAKYRAGGGCR
jgi:hypothetical protein